LKNNDNGSVTIDSVLYGSLKTAAAFLSRETGEKITARQIKTAAEYGLAIWGHKVRYNSPEQTKIAVQRGTLLLRYPPGGSPLERGINKI
jgi:hypothetical protein